MDLTSEVFTSVLSPLAAFLTLNTTTTTTTPPDPPTTTTTTTDTDSENEHNPHLTTPFTATDTTPPSPSRSLNLTEWQTSPLNPQSRLDSLAPLTLPASSSNHPSSSSWPESSSESESDPWHHWHQRHWHWRLDGADPTVTRFHATPHFAFNKPPLRVDVYLPPVEDWPEALRRVVKPQEATYRGVGIDKLDVGRWLGRVLWRWARDLAQKEEGEGGKKGGDDRNGEGNGNKPGENDKQGEGKGDKTGETTKKQKTGLEKQWWDLPFGSFISVSFDNIGTEMVHLVPDYKVEQGMLPLPTLQKMWEADSVSWDGVAVVDWERLRFKRQVHEVISLVAVDGVDRELVFKSVLSPQEQRYMYNELKMLLLLGPHANIISRPVGIVTKRGRFGNRRGVCGFLLEWFSLGSLRERLLRDDYCLSTSMEQRFQWAQQVTRALAHVNGHERAGFYPDLKPDNILLREDTETGMLGAVLIDLEQRGGWFAWSPPEVAYVEYLEILASDSMLPEDGMKCEIIEQLREYYGDPDWPLGEFGRQRYYKADGGFSRPWLALLKERRAGGKGRDLLERAQVFMLGKLLWCIFEGQPMVRCGIDHEVLRDADPDYHSTRSGKAKAFPEFKETPNALRELIRACTSGAPEWEKRPARRLPGVVLRQGKLSPAAAEADMGTLTPEDTRNAARRFWGCELARAREFMQELLLFKGGISQHGDHEQPKELHSPASACGLLDQIRNRPLLSEVLAELERIKRALPR
ncbi:U-box domain-protein 33 [Achaetomium macrosporum]|uniref:U-box domain-protein 33 n=1 Tax=Achaetomium macrosporum TaxID=79813 RepID=A0AAN7CBB6_9PEZI|nr:U-box domain-protein 33 [Achaetomium macrosporum]